MNIKHSVIALLLAALPATALAAPHGDGGAHNDRPAPRQSHSEPQRSYARPQRTYAQPQRTYAQPQRRYVEPQHQYVQDRRYVQPTQRYVAQAPQHNWSGHPWGWNGGRAWYASPRYWGGGFWGAFALGLTVGDVGYYQVQSGYPGYELLANYGLQQTSCDQPDLVNIFGPDGSEICAYPNDMVAPGDYSVDPATLTLLSQ